MTPQQLAICTGARIDRAREWLPHIEAAMREFEINTPLRQAALGHMRPAQSGFDAPYLRLRYSDNGCNFSLLHLAFG